MKQDLRGQCRVDGMDVPWTRGKFFLWAAELAFEAAAEGKRRHTCCREGCDETEAKAGKFKRCSRFFIARYCSAECGAAAWKDGHKYTCTKIASPSAPQPR